MYRLPGFVLSERPVRKYPFEAAANVLGYLGEVDTTFLRKHKGEGYEMGDYAGMTGLESSYEKVLMGQRGVKRYIRDNKTEYRVLMKMVFMTQLPSQAVIFTAV